jgi:hypothetical protein
MDALAHEVAEGARRTGEGPVQMPEQKAENASRGGRAPFDFDFIESSAPFRTSSPRHAARRGPDRERNQNTNYYSHIYVLIILESLGHQSGGAGDDQVLVETSWDFHNLHILAG